MKALVHPVLCAALLALGLWGTQARSQDSYADAVAAVMADPGTVPDYAVLRQLYAASPGADGLAAIAALRTDAMKEGAAVPATEAVTAAIAADFPLLETHYNAYQYFDWLGGPDAEALKTRHFDHYMGLMDAILASERKVGGLRTFTVLSVGEEYEVLGYLKLEATMQALVNIDGAFFDRQDTAEGPILFDISAFFGK